LRGPALLRDRACWLLRQKEYLERLGQHTSREPLRKGVSTFALSTLEAVEARLQFEAGLSARWEALSKRLRLIYTEPEAAFRALDFAALIAGKAEARERLQHLEKSPEVFGPLRGSQSFFASMTEREETLTQQQRQSIANKSDKEHC